jgi:hypothetical protein
VARQVGIVLYVLAPIAAVVSLDILFLTHHLTGRLIANVGIVLAFAAAAGAMRQRLRNLDYEGGVQGGGGLVLEKRAPGNRIQAGRRG